MPVLHSAPGDFRMPIHDVQSISQELDIPVSDIYGVATFFTPSLL